MRVLFAFGVVATCLMGVAHADVKRIVLADPDPELRRALEASLSPWRLEILVESVAPRDIGAARQRARERDARFVVWRSGGDLVIYDRERATTERRDARSGALDPPAAASAALTVKTLMRLPPPVVTSPAARSSKMAPVVPPVAQQPARSPASAPSAKPLSSDASLGARPPHASAPSSSPRSLPAHPPSEPGAAPRELASRVRSRSPSTSHARPLAERSADPPSGALATTHARSAARPLRIQAGVASRLARGSETSLGARFEGAAFLRPWRSRGLRVGLGVELGTASAISTTGFKGEWSDESASVIVGWTLDGRRPPDRGRWQLEPHVGIGVTRSRLDGVEMSMSRSEVDAFVVASAGLWTRYRFGGFSIGAGLQVVFSPGTPTYMRAESSVEMFRVPAVGAALGVVSAYDLPL